MSGNTFEEANVVPFTDRQNISLGNAGSSDKSADDSVLEPEVKILVELNKTAGNLKLLNTEKRNRIKKTKVKMNVGEKRKRKHSGNVENHKKIKRKRKDENFLGSNKMRINEANIVVSCQNDTVLPETPNKEKSENSCKEVLKQVSGKKLKTVINECRETLDALVGFSFEVLQSMELSLRILKENNFLNNKLISVDTLIELIKIAIESNGASDEIVSEQEKNFSILIENITKTRNNSKTPKAKRNILNPLNNTKSAMQSTSCDSACLNEEDVIYLGDNENKSNESKEQIGANLEQNKLNPNCESFEKAGKNFITNYFKKLEKTLEKKERNERINAFSVKADELNGSKFEGDILEFKRRRLEKELENQNCPINYLMENQPKECKKIRSHKSKTGEIPSAEKALADLQAEDKLKAKLLQFHENRRPPYWGTWRKKSDAIKPRKPFGKDQVLNYDVDSDEEWEGEEEPGESLHGSDDEKEPEEDYEVDNEFFVPHGYLSDDENPEKENVPLDTLNSLEEQLSSESNRKSRKMTPIVCGVYWFHEGFPPEGSLYADLHVGRLEAVPWDSLPIEVEEAERRKTGDGDGDREPEPYSQSKKLRGKVLFPNDEVPNLIKIIHGSPQNSDQLARKFLHHWQSLDGNQENGKRLNLTKKCVLKKIKELATWQISQDSKKMCWLVPKETQKEFGAEVEAEETRRNPQKCYIWKFIKKVDKKMGVSIEVAQEPKGLVVNQ